MKKNLLLYFFLTLLLIFPLVTSVSCSNSQALIRDGKEYGKVKGAFRNRWWNYYERGLSYLEGRFYKEAREDFENAIKQRPEDKRMARTYGMHFIDYFPNREMGLAYYLAGDYEKAKKNLDLSNEQQPSAKARYYLDKIRKQLFEQQGLSVSVPEIKADLPGDVLWTRDDPIMISGTVTDDQYVSEITVSGKNCYIEASSQKVSFKEELNLGQGKHILEITARNLLGGQARQERVIHVDRQGPVITLEPYPTDTKTRNYIKGYLYDESGRISLSVNGAAFPTEDGEEVSFNIPVNPEDNKIILLARDRAGNETRAQIDLKNISARKEYTRLAWLDSPQIISDAGFSIGSLLSKKDKEAPLITLPDWAEEQTVFLDRIYLEGEVRDESEIVDLRVNGTPVLHRESPMIFFNQLINLKEGKNLIQITAKDKKGNIAKKTICINREVPNVLKLASRLSLAIFPFEIKGTKNDIAQLYRELFFVKLMDQNRFRILEREKLDVILREQKISGSGIVDQNTAIEVGKLMAAQTSLVGTIIETNIGLEIVARLIDNETSEILAVKDVYDETEDKNALSTMAEGLAIKFCREFPLVEGIIVKKKKDVFFTDLGNGKIRQNRRLIIYRTEPIYNPKTGKFLGNDPEIIGFGRVFQVMDNMSKGDFLKGLNADAVKDTDKVMSQ